MENLAGMNMHTLLAFSYLSIALLLATLVRKQLLILQRLMIPSAIIAGVILLLAGRQVFALAPVSLDTLNQITYHLLTGIFICLGLRKTAPKKSGGVWSMTLVICKGYALLAILGIIFTLAWIRFLFPLYPPPFSMMPLLGFGFDGHIATSIGLQWEEGGFPLGSHAGFSFGVMGLLWAYVGGIILAYWARRRRGAGQEELLPREALEGVIGSDGKKPVGGYLTTVAEEIESFSLHLALIGLVFFITYAALGLLSERLGAGGGAQALLGVIIWQYNFIFAAFFASIVRKIIDWLNVDHLFDDGLMARASGTMMDYLVAAAIASITLFIFSSYWVEVVILSLLCGLALIFFSRYIAVKIYADYPLERSVATFGLLTGTIAAALALLRMVDPKMEMPIVRELGYASGLSILVGLPALVLITLPATGAAAGEPVRYLVVSLLLFAAYAALLFLAWFILLRRKNRTARQKMTAS